MLRHCLVAILAAGPLAAADLPARAEVEGMIAKAEAYLLGQQQPDGGFTEGARYALGITQLATIGLTMKPGLTAQDPRIARALAFMEGFSQPDGGLYPPDEGLGTYYTSLALLTWAATGTGSTERITRAQNYLYGVQETDAGLSQGGFGYGGRKGHADLSNSDFAIQALRASGVPPSEPHLQAAVKFLERCQDLSAVNKLPWAKDSGGGVYSPDESKADGSWNREPPKAGDPPPRLAPYGSMTYALISTYVVLDVKPTDPRVAAALGWVKANYTFDKNPGTIKKGGQEGLFYYYRLMSKTYDVLGTKAFELKDGTTVDWRADLFAALKKRATVEGDKAYWSNPIDRWGEDLPVLVTSYVLKSLKAIDKSL